MRRPVVAILVSVLLVAGAPRFAASQQASQPASEAGAEKQYLLGPGDQVSVQVIDVEEFTGKAVRVDESGNVVLPMIGRTEAGGLTAAQLAAAITLRLTRFVVKPEVTVTIAERRTEPVTVSGAVRTPGVLNVPQGKTLFEVLAMAGGILQDAGYRVRVTRRVTAGTIPVANVQKDPSGQYFVADVSLKGIEEGSSAENIPILGNDFISVPRAELIYVIGDVKRTGAFALAEGQTVSVLQAIAMAEGPLKTATPSKASIQRISGEDKRINIPVDIDKIMKEKEPDIQLHAKDILVVPGSTSHGALERTLNAILTIGSGAVIRLY